MRPYSSYKNSAIEWLGDVPTNWDVVPMTKYLESIADYRGKTPSKNEFGGIFLVTARNIKGGRIDYSLSQEYVDPNEYGMIMSRGLPKIGDVLLTMEAPLGEVANVDKEEIALAQRVIKLRGKRKVLNNYFLKYWMLSAEFQNHLQSLATGSTALGLKASKLNLLKITLPAHEEQNQIVDFIDHKIEKISELIDKKERMIELLKEERSAIINQTVTRGLDLDVELKDSGIGWLGKIPKHWEIKKLKFNALVQFSNVDKKSEEGELAVRLCNYVDVYYNDFITPDLDFMEATASPEEIKKFHLKAGDVLLTKDSEEWSDIAVPAFVTFEEPDLICGYHLAQVRPQVEKIEGKYLFWLMSANCVNYQFRTEASGITRYGLSNYALSNSLCLIPPRTEQKEIAMFLDKKTVQIDGQVEREKRSIELLKEFRTSLISEAVTGKIDVREKQ